MKEPPPYCAMVQCSKADKLCHIQLHIIEFFSRFAYIYSSRWEWKFESFIYNNWGMGSKRSPLPASLSASLSQSSSSKKLWSLGCQNKYGISNKYQIWSCYPVVLLSYKMLLLCRLSNSCSQKYDLRSSWSIFQLLTLIIMTILQFSNGGAWSLSLYQRFNAKLVDFLDCMNQLSLLSIPNIFRRFLINVVQLD